MASVKRDDCRAAGATSTMIASAADANARGLTSPQYRRGQVCKLSDRGARCARNAINGAKNARPGTAKRCFGDLTPNRSDVTTLRPQSERRDNVTIESDGARVA